MALTVTKTVLRRYIARKLGYNRTYSSMTGTQQTDVNDVLNDALRRFYEPAVVPKHHWSFLFPTVPFSFAEGQWTYLLPDDFAMPHGPLTYMREEDVTYPPIELTAPEKILSNQHRDNSSGVPRMAAIRPAAPRQGLGTRHELIVYPTSDGDYKINLTYKINPYSLDSDTELPLGGQAHVQTVIAACLAAAADFDDYEGDKYEIRFKEHLAASISHDQQLGAPESLGVNYDTSDGFDVYDNTMRQRWWGGSSVVTYNGSSDF